MRALQVFSVASSLLMWIVMTTLAFLQFNWLGVIIVGILFILTGIVTTFLQGRARREQLLAENPMLVYLLEIEKLGQRYASEPTPTRTNLEVDPSWEFENEKTGTHIRRMKEV